MQPSSRDIFYDVLRNLKARALALAHMEQPLYEQAKNQLLNMIYADCFYILSYPTYDGYKILHDPTYTAYPTITNDSTPNPFTGLLMLVFTLVVVAAIIATIVIIVKLRRKPTSETPV